MSQVRVLLRSPHGFSNWEAEARQAEGAGPAGLVRSSPGLWVAAAQWHLRESTGAERSSWREQIRPLGSRGSSGSLCASRDNPGLVFSRWGRRWGRHTQVPLRSCGEQRCPAARRPPCPSSFLTLFIPCGLVLLSSKLPSVSWGIFSEVYSQG